jgi:hypothetical protein
LRPRRGLEIGAGAALRVGDLTAFDGRHDVRESRACGILATRHVEAEAKARIEQLEAQPSTRAFSFEHLLERDPRRTSVQPAMDATEQVETVRGHRQPGSAESGPLENEAARGDLRSAGRLA